MRQTNCRLDDVKAVRLVRKLILFGGPSDGRESSQTLNG